MKLGLAGVISGMGQGLGQGLQTLNSGLVQMGVQQSLAKNDREFQMEKQRIQMEHENAMTDRKIAGDKANTEAQIAAQSAANKDLATLKGGIDAGLQQSDQASKEKLAKMKIDADSQQNVLGLAIRSQIADKDREALLKQGREKLNLEREKIKSDTFKTIVTDDNRVAAFGGGGAPLGYLKNKDGNDVIVQKNLTSADMTVINSLLKAMDEDQNAYSRQPIHNEGDYEKLQQRVTDRLDKIERITRSSSYSKEPKTTQAAPPAPEFNRGPYTNYQDPRQSATPSVRQAPPMQAPITSSPQVTKPKGIVEGAVDQFKKTPSWMDLLSPNRQ